MEGLIMRIIAIDLETPNMSHDRICSLGIAIIEEGNVIKDQYYLIDPECYFDYRNTNIHGISKESVQGMPAFPAVWNEIRSLLHTNLIVAHNANFDLTVLRKTLSYYGLTEEEINYIDTLEIASSILSDVKNFKLPTLCQYFGIDLKHHDASSDAVACGEILCRLMNQSIDFNRYEKKYQLDIPYCPKNQSEPRQLCDLTHDLVELNNIINNITDDGILDNEEVFFLQNWMEEHIHLKGNYPYDIILSALAEALEDGILEQTELDKLLILLKQSISPIQTSCTEGLKLIVSDKSICLSGDFEYGSKNDVAQQLSKLGAIIQNNVTKKTDILIVGNEGSIAWYAGNYGTKVKKALELQEKGHNISIINESEFFDSIKEDE